MNLANTRYLFRNFPFFHPEAPITESLMYYGFECGNGWFQLIKELCEELSVLNLGPDFRVIQVKQKLAGLRFYVNRIDEKNAEKVMKLIAIAETKSFKICEQCGKPGSKIDQNGSLRTRCEDCRNKWD